MRNQIPQSADAKVVESDRLYLPDKKARLPRFPKAVADHQVGPMMASVVDTRLAFHRSFRALVEREKACPGL